MVLPGRVPMPGSLAPRVRLHFDALRIHVGQRTRGVRYRYRQRHLGNNFS